MSKQKYNTAEEAEKGAMEARQNIKMKFCPLIQASCRVDCECYCAASTYVTSEGDHQVALGYCSNAMFLGSACNYV